MTATERAKRSDALYYETASVTRRVLCDMIANREADLEDAQAENAKLREERDYYEALWEHATVTDCELRRVRAAWKEDRKQNAKLRDELDAAKHDLSLFSERIVELGADNAKLRELVDYMTPIALYSASEQERDRMRELGAEVTE